MKSFSLSWSKCFGDSPVIPIDKSISTQGCERFVGLFAFSYDELKDATNCFHSANKIGEGGFGSVYKGTLKDGRHVAVKVLSVDSKQGDSEFMSEIDSMININHENLVKVYGGCTDRGSRIIVYEYMQNNNLAHILLGGEARRAILSWELRREICVGVARALAYIHEDCRPHIVHRDIKASNILLDRNYAPKLSDFGLSKLFGDDVTHISTRVAGTLGYLAPEYAFSGKLARKSDIYSFGVLLLEIVSGRSAVDFDLELGEHHLVEKAWDMYRAKRLTKLIDPVLKGNFDETEAVQFIKVGLLCVQEICSLRPQMSTAVKMMMGMINVDDTKITQPGVIADMALLKIGKKIPSRKSSSSQLQMRRLSCMYIS